MSQRVDDVTRLLIAGAEFSDIRQFAATHGWGVSDRQIRRYLTVAYEQMAKTTRRKREQSLGLHLKKRRALYARSVKANDNRMALQILRDEADLQGLYSSAKSRLEAAKDEHPNPSGTTIPIRQRTARYVAAELRNDKIELELLERASNFTTHSIADTHVANLTLNLMARIYVMEQMEQLSNYFYANCRAWMTCGSETAWDSVTMSSAYRFKANREGWMQFANWLGVSGDDVVAVHAPSFALAYHQDEICADAPTADELLAQIDEDGLQRPVLLTSEYHAKTWQEVFCSSFRDRSAG